MAKTSAEMFVPSSASQAWLEAIETFLRGGGRGYSENTRATYRGILRKLAAYVRSQGCDSPDALTLVHLELWGHALEARGLSERSRALYTSATKKFVGWMRAHDLVDGKLEGWRLGAVLPLRRSASDAPVLVPHESEVAAMLEAGDPRDRAILALSAFVGLRPSAIGKIKGRDFVVKDGELYLQLRDGKRQREQIVPLANRVVEAVDIYLGETGRSFPFEGFLFRTEDPAGDRRGSEGLSRWTIARTIKRMGGETMVSPRALRHHLAVRYLEAGGELVDLQHVLGHASLDTTTVYLRARQLEASRRTIERVVKSIESRQSLPPVDTEPQIEKCLEPDFDPRRDD